MILLPNVTKLVIIYVKTLTNISYVIEMDFKDTIDIFKHRILAKYGIPVLKQRIIFFGREIKEGIPCININEFAKEGMVYLVVLK